MEFKDKVKFVREKLCLSQQDLAKAAGISFNTINRWENGLRKWYNFYIQNEYR